MKTKISKEKFTTVRDALSAVMAALVCVATFIIKIPNPPTHGYINFGDLMIFVSALTFGAIIGGYAGGVGSALADMVSGYTNFALYTLIIKGAEGIISGLISNKKSLFRDILAVIVAGVEMIAGYFLVEWYLYGWGAALTEVPGNISQIAVGGGVGIPLAIIIRRRLPEALKHRTRSSE